MPDVLDMFAGMGACCMPVPSPLVGNPPVLCGAPDVSLFNPPVIDNEPDLWGEFGEAGTFGI